MECELVQQKIALFAYGELPDDQCHLLESHLVTCKRCEEEFAAVQALQQAMALAPAFEPSANLLAQARLKLEEALDNMPRAGWLMRAQQSFFRGLSGLGRAPVAASALLVVGLSGGGWTGYHAALRNQPKQPDMSLAPSGAPESIASVSSIVREPNSENVAIRFNRAVPEVAQGSIHDPRIQELLVAAAQSQLGTVTQKSVSLLAEECEAEHQCPGGSIRQALLKALRYDSDAHVRLGALKGLKPLVADDMQVRDGVLDALQHDRDPAVRTRAIDLLTPVEADSSVREVLQHLASEDANPHIRLVSQKVLAAPFQIQ